MKRFFKALSIAFLVLSIGAYSAVIYGATAIPDEFNIAADESIELSGIFSAQESERISPADSSGAGGEYKTRVTALGVIPVKEVTVNATKRRYVGIGGNVFGIKLYTKGVIVVGMDSVTTSSGSADPASAAGIKSGDIITHINDNPVLNSQQLTDAVEQSQGKELRLTVDRNGETANLKLKPAMSVNGKYKAGIWVRDSSAGIGTVTFYDDSSRMFAGLGHGVCDVDTGKIMPLNNGEAVRARVNGFYKSSAGNPGELCGVFSDVALGSLRVNHETGVFGELIRPSGAKTLPVALESEIKPGKAQMVTTIDENEPQYYDIEIIKIYPSSDLSSRNMIIKVTDARLIEKTGGILRGMSGSPIVQNSMLVGAVTHVFVNDPQQGYAIFAGRMLDTLDTLKNGERPAA